MRKKRGTLTSHCHVKAAALHRGGWSKELSYEMNVALNVDFNMLKGKWSTPHTFDISKKPPHSKCQVMSSPNSVSKHYLSLLPTYEENDQYCGHFHMVINHAKLNVAQLFICCSLKHRW